MILSMMKNMFGIDVTIHKLLLFPFEKNHLTNCVLSFTLLGLMYVQLVLN
jgi:hypothetical protein